MASPIRFERMTSWSGTTRAVLLRHGDVKCAGKDSNLRVGCLGYGQVRSPLRHRRLGWPKGLEPSMPGFTVRVLGRFGFSHRAQRRNRTSVPRLWAGRSPIELAELERAQEESNFHLGIRSPVPDPLDHGRSVPAPGAEPGTSSLSRKHSAAELCGLGGDDGFRSRYLQLDGLALSRLSYITMAPAR